MAVKKSILWIDKAYNNDINNVLTQNSTFVITKKKSFSTLHVLLPVLASFLSCIFSPTTSVKIQTTIFSSLEDLLAFTARRIVLDHKQSVDCYNIASNFQHIFLFSFNKQRTKFLISSLSPSLSFTLFAIFRFLYTHIHANYSSFMDEQ